LKKEIQAKHLHKGFQYLIHKCDLLAYPFNRFTTNVDRDKISSLKATYDYKKPKDKRRMETLFNAV